MDKLSVVIITYNEQDNIGRCIESVNDLADEIVVVDSFSTDRTREICLSYGKVNFYEHPFSGHIEQKNYAASLAKYDYVLSLDADEALDERLFQSIRQEKAAFSSDGYYMNRMTNYLGKWIRHGAWYPDRKLRLWNRHKGAWGGQNPHDRFEMLPESKRSHLHGDILHYSYTSIEGHIRQFDKFTSISAHHMQREGVEATLLNVFLNPVVNFVKGFVFKRGFLDGYYGIVICVINAFATFIKYVKLRELNKGKTL